MRFIILLMFALFLTISAAQAEVLIITNKSVGETTLSSNDIRNIFLGKKKKWPDNTKISFVLSDNENLHLAFLDMYIHRSSSQFLAYWKNMVFTGKGEFPKKLNSNKEIIDFVANTKGAIGYIDSSSPAANVNTISVNN